MTEGAKGHLESHPAWGGEGNKSKFSNHNNLGVHCPVLTTGTMNFTWGENRVEKKTGNHTGIQVEAFGTNYKKSGKRERSKINLTHIAFLTTILTSV